VKRRGDIGSLGEELAAKYLEQQGFQILRQNYRQGRGEIDIICIKKDLLVFVEVKSRSFESGLRPSKMVTHSQQRKIKITALSYLGDSDWYGLVRFDLVEVVLVGGGSITHYPGYFN
jgi:putative endonuclease